MPPTVTSLTEKGREKGRELFAIMDQMDELEKKKQLILKDLIEISDQKLQALSFK